MHTENQKVLNTSEQLAASVLNWASDTNQMAEPTDFKEDLEDMFKGFMSSVYADDVKKRISIMVLYEHFNNLFDTLGQFQHDDFRGMDKINQKLINVS